MKSAAANRSHNLTARTNGRPGIGIALLKEPDANTPDATNGVLDAPAAYLIKPGDLPEWTDVRVQPGPVTISRTNGARSATITGDMTSDDAQAVGIEIQAKIDALDIPPGVVPVVYILMNESVPSLFGRRGI